MMAGTIIQQTITFFRTEGEASLIAAANGADDADWSYKVEAWEPGFVVVIHDEDGRYLGAL